MEHFFQKTGITLEPRLIPDLSFYPTYWFYRRPVKLSIIYFIIEFTGSKEPFLKMLLKIFRLTLRLEFWDLYLLMIYEKESNLFFKGKSMKFRLDIMRGEIG